MKFTFEIWQFFRVIIERSNHISNIDKMIIKRDDISIPHPYQLLLSLFQLGSHIRLWIHRWIPIDG